MSLKVLIRDVVILAVLSISIILCVSYGCGAAEAATMPGENEEEIIDLLWWLRRGGALNFMEEMSALGDGYATLSGYFHHGPSR